ncbi:MAG: GAF domain-containing protein, partial [candidate division NC10 bacterium]|nr:GAF domain-containing protein [candidate division NC10 bacterium]
LEAVASLGTEEPPETLRVPIGPEGGGIAQAYLTQQMIGWDGRGPVPESYHLQPPYDQIGAFRSHAFANVPLIVHGRTIGVLGVDRKQSRQPLDAATLELLQLFAGQAALAIEQARLFAATERAAREARSLYEVAHTLTTSLDVTEVLHLVSVKTTELLGTPHAQVVLWDEATQTLRLGAAHGTEAQRAQAQEFRLGQGVNGIVAQTRAPLIVNDYQAFPQRMPWLTELVAVIGVPLLYRDRLLGVLTSHATQPGSAFTQELLALLTSFADQAAAAIENSRLYEDVRQHAAILGERVRERTRDLEAANHALAEASRHKSEFLANMSHEIRTPLNSIIGFAELVGEQRVGPLNEKQARYLGHIQNSGKHLLQLISDILDLSKVEAGKFVLQPEPLPVAQTLEDILVIARGLAKKKHQIVEADIAPDFPSLQADPVRFKQILFNLLSNAVKFTPEGGRITVTARPTPGGTGEAGKRRAGERDFLEIAVQDTGVGIRPEDLPRLFQGFVQLETTQAQRHEGTGLGLALTKKLVELHGGQIWAESPGEGKGSTFTLMLPFAGPQK